MYAVSRFAREKIQPLVREMDAASYMDKSVINALFEQGVSMMHLFTKIEGWLLQT